MKPLTITLPLPDYALTLNGTRNRFKRARLAKEHRGWAKLKAQSLLTKRPHFPAGVPVQVDVRVERKPRGRRMDDSAVIECLKAYIDGLEDAGVFEDDRCVRWGSVEWDLKPTGRGLVHLCLSVMDAT